MLDIIGNYHVEPVTLLPVIPPKEESTQEVILSIAHIGSEKLKILEISIGTLVAKFYRI